VSGFPAGWNRLHGITLWAVAVECSSQPNSVAVDSKIAKMIGWGPAYDNDAVLQKSLRSSLESLRAVGAISFPAGRGREPFLHLQMTEAGRTLVPGIERMCLDRDMGILLDFQGMAKVNRYLTSDMLLQTALEREPPPPMQPRHFRKILRAKIFQELVLSIEELGALCHAIRNRGDMGIVYQFLKYQIPDVRRFFNMLVSEDVTLDVLLRLPDRDTIRTNLEDSLARRVFSVFDDRLDWLRQGAEVYLDRDVAGAMNRTKHGFVVIDNPDLHDLRSDLNPEDLGVLLSPCFDGRNSEATWTFDFVPMTTSKDEQQHEVDLMGEMYLFQVDLIGVLNVLHSSQVDMTLCAT
jgi:hypothetical protein